MRDIPASRFCRRQHGLTLIELMVALVIGLIFSIAVLLVQINLSKQNVQMSDAMERDTQARAALDLLTRDLTNAGFMLGGAQSPCAAMFAYNANLSTPTFQQYPVMATNQPLPLPVSNPPSGSNDDPNAYPPTGQTNTSQMLFIQGVSSALQSPGSGLAPTPVVQNSTTKAPPGQGAVHATRLPLNTTAGLKAGDTAMLRMPLNGQMVCFRVPITNVGPSVSPASTYITSKDPVFFPSTGYAGFESVMQKEGLLSSGQSLANANFVQSTLTDLGPSSNKQQQLQVFYIANDQNAAGSTLPMLFRATINAANDTLIGNPEPIAAGVVSMQFLFGVDETQSGAITNYLSWSNVVAGSYTNDVRSVLFAIVSRTLQLNPNNPPVATVTVPSPADSGGFGPDKFTDYTPPQSANRYRYSVLESEVALRNLLWTH